MKILCIALAITAGIIALGNLAGCSASTATIGVNENIGIADSPQLSPLSPPATININENIWIADSPQLSPLSLPTTIDVVETIGITDSPTLEPEKILPTQTQSAVSVTSPKEGEIWQAGTFLNINWTTTGEDIAYIAIYYSTDAGYSMMSIAEHEPDDGTYSWEVPDKPSPTVLVRVLAYNDKGETLTLGDSGLFTISSQQNNNKNN